jgi:hypothetical protein
MADIGSMLTQAVSEMSLWAGRAASNNATLSQKREQLYQEQQRGPAGAGATGPLRLAVEILTTIVDLCTRFMKAAGQERDTALTLLETASKKPQVQA